MYMEECQGGGSLNSLMTKTLISFCLLFTLTSGCAVTEKEGSPKECVNNVLNLKVVRVDERNHRFFLVSKQIKAKDILNNQSPLQKCFLGTEWQSDWSLSVFTDVKYAGYKDEERIAPFHKNNMWAKAYLFEYDKISGSLIESPAFNPRQIMP